MNKDELKQSLTPNDIEQVLKYYNADFFYNNQGVIQIATVCHNTHGGSHKLYYYPDSQNFHCFTDCSESFDIYGLIERVSETRGEHINFNEAYHLLGDITQVNTSQKLKKKIGFGEETDQTIDDWSWITGLKRRRTHEPELKEVNESVLDSVDFKEWYPDVWIDEGINIETMELFGIKFYPERNQVLIPHRNQEGKLIGIRTRNFRDEDAYGKYTPLFYRGEMFNHPLGFSLYGLDMNKETIKKRKKIMIVESEKSCLKAHSYWGDNSFVVSICGSSLNAYQADMILRLGIEDIIISVDKDFINTSGKEYNLYIKKLQNISKHFINKANLYHLTDTRGIMGYKECVMDRGKEEIINIMEHDKHEITSLERLGEFDASKN